jgi:hypothetical protein|tara:strand:+ start:86 stop:286 length:201 start_codon:yes stop_codon:yes gene_type:complete
MSEEVKSLEDQLIDQRNQLEESVRQLEGQLSRVKEQYLKVLGALEFAAIQKQQQEEAANIQEEGAL